MTHSVEMIWQRIPPEDVKEEGCQYASQVTVNGHFVHSGNEENAHVRKFQAEKEMAIDFINYLKLKFKIDWVV